MSSAHPTILKRAIGALVSSVAMLANTHATPASQPTLTPQALQVLIYVVNTCRFDPSAATGAALLVHPFVQDRVARAAAKGGDNGFEEVQPTDCITLARTLPNSGR